MEKENNNSKCKFFACVYAMQSGCAITGWMSEEGLLNGKKTYCYIYDVMCIDAKCKECAHQGQKCVKLNKLEVLRMKLVQPIREPEKLDEIKQKLKGKSDRNYMMFVIGIYTGLRISDIRLLKVKDVKKEHLKLIEKKTGKEKRILIIPILKRELAWYTNGKSEEEYLLKSRKGEKPITRIRAYQILREIAKDCGIDEVGTHTLRKTFGYHFYQQFKDIATLMDIFNHSSESITRRYIGITQDIKDKKMRNLKF
jgi:integrase